MMNVSHTPVCRSGGLNYTDNRVQATVSMTALEDQLGGTVHIFRGCIQAVTASAFCRNGGVPWSDALASRGALYIESPSCSLQLNSSYFAQNQAALDGGAVQVSALARRRRSRLL